MHLGDGSVSSAASTSISSRASRWFALIKEALLGSGQDFTAISIDRAIVLLAVPMVLEMAMESLFGVVDIFFVAHLGADATATVGITEGMLVMVFAIALGLSMGTTAVVARRTGEHDPAGAARAAVQAIMLGLAASLLIFAICFPLAPKFLAFMGASPSILRTGSTYTRTMLSGSGVIVMLFLMNAIFRGAGDAAVAMRVLWLANFINIFLDPCLILGLGPFPRLGVTGAAVSTTIGRSIGILYQLYIFAKRSERIQILREHLRLDWKVMLNIMRLAATGTLQFLIVTASWLFMVRMVQSFGSAVTAGYTVAIRIVIFSILPSWGLGAAAATLVGQNLGARRPDRAAQSVWRAGFFNMIFLGVISLVFLALAPKLIGIFSPDPRVIGYGADCLRIISLSYIVYAYGLVILQAFNGAGDTITPSIINLISYWAVQLPLAYLLGMHYRFGPNGLYTAMLIADVMLSVLSIFIFRQGRWKLKVV
jgi:putative MATE family efflux protein